MLVRCARFHTVVRKRLKHVLNENLRRTRELSHARTRLIFLTVHPVGKTETVLVIQ